MKKTILLPSLVALLSLGTGLSAKPLPDNIAAAIKAAYPNAKIQEFDSEKEHGGIVYEVEIETGERELILKFDDNATMLETEEEIGFEAIPQGVEAEYHKIAPRETLLEVEKSTSPSKGVRYELKSRGEMGSRSFIFSESGQLVSVKHKHSGEDEEDDEDDE